MWAPARCSGTSAFVETTKIPSFSKRTDSGGTSSIAKLRLLSGCIDVEELRNLWQQRSRLLVEGLQTSRDAVRFVQALRQLHLLFIPSRLIPRTLTNQPERMVWRPRAASVTPGITQRIVCA